MVTTLFILFSAMIALALWGYAEYWKNQAIQANETILQWQSFSGQQDNYIDLLIAKVHEYEIDYAPIVLDWKISKGIQPVATLGTVKQTSKGKIGKNTVQNPGKIRKVYQTAFMDMPAGYTPIQDETGVVIFEKLPDVPVVKAESKLDDKTSKESSKPKAENKSNGNGNKKTADNGSKDDQFSKANKGVNWIDVRNAMSDPDKLNVMLSNDESQWVKDHVESWNKANHSLENMVKFTVDHFKKTGTDNKPSKAKSNGKH